MRTKDYLARIALDSGSLNADIETLRILQRSHLLAVPFENLDIHWNRPIALDQDRFYKKIVTDRRGGFCYELNGLFESLLEDLGYTTRLVSARVFNGTQHGPEFDHVAIIVSIGDDEFLVDVGFGAFTAEPLPFVRERELIDEAGTFLIRKREDGYCEVMKRDDGVWRSEYIFRDVPHELSDFAEMCEFQQYSPESHFRKGKLCSIMTDTGRKTLTERSLIITTNGQKKERQVHSEAEFYELLLSEFGIAPARR